MNYYPSRESEDGSGRLALGAQGYRIEQSVNCEAKVTESQLTIPKQGSVRTELGKLIISAADFDGRTRVALVVGRVGFPNVTKALQAGGAVLFETPDDGLIEVRVLGIDYSADEIEVLVSLVLPRQGMRGGFVESDANNAPFSPAEVQRIRKSLDTVKVSARERGGLSPEQVDFISRKLDEMQEASERFGRRDWINLAVGTITNVIVTAALGPDAGKFLLQTVGSALSWLVGAPLKLIP